MVLSHEFVYEPEERGLAVGIAYERCGFGSVVAFRDAFRRMCGVNPSDWTALRQ